MGILSTHMLDTMTACESYDEMHETLYESAEKGWYLSQLGGISEDI